MKRSRPKQEVAVERVLVVGACPLTRFGILTTVECDGSLRVCAEAGDAALARQLCAKHLPDIVIVDTNGEIGGVLTLLRELIRMHPPVLCVVVSEWEDAHTVQRFFRAGARGCVSRREEAVLLLLAANVVREGHVYASDRLTRGVLTELAGDGVNTTAEGLEVLSDRELEIFERLGQGEGANATAQSLKVSVKTVETYRRRVMEKLGLQSGQELRERAKQFVSHQAARSSPVAPRRKPAAA